MGPRGVLYGTTLAGGAYGSSCAGPPYGPCGGTVFSLSPPTSEGGAWTEAVLWSFGGHPGDGIAPNDIVMGGNGVLYGTTENGGPYYVPPDGGCPDPRGEFIYCEGTVFSLTPPTEKGGAWAESVLWSFGGTASDGSWPNGVVVGSGGVLYGTTRWGSKIGVVGTVFALSPPASPGGVWTEQDIHGFLGNGQQLGGGGSPYGNLLLAGSGVLYGTTFDGGEPGVGAVFALRPPASPGDPWTPAALWDFQLGSGGQTPAAALVRGANGVLYGTASGYAEGGVSAVFALAP